MRINYKSDFDFIMKFKDCEGKETTFPDCDWDAVFWTSNKANNYTASCHGGVYINCFKEDDGRIHFVFNNHALGAGVVKWEPHFMLPDTIFPDEVRDTYTPEPLGIELVSGKGDCPTTAEIELVAPFIKGDKMTYADLTEQDKADLIAPIKEDIDKAIAQGSGQVALTTSDDLQISDSNVLSLTDKGKMRAFIDLWDSACYQYGGYKPDEAPDSAKPFLLNGFWFSYDEALEIYNVSVKDHRYNFDYGYTGCRLKTVLPIVLYSHVWSGRYAFSGCQNFVRISFKGPNYGNDIFINPVAAMFSDCNALEEVLSDCKITVSYKSSATTDVFKNCHKLREIRFSAVSDFDIHWSPLLSLATVQSFVSVTLADPIVITVHEDVYAKLTGDTTNTAASALTTEELAQWQQVLTDGAANNISFATA